MLSSWQYLLIEAVEVTTSKLFGKVLSKLLGLTNRLQCDGEWFTLKNSLFSVCVCECEREGVATALGAWDLPYNWR